MVVRGSGLKVTQVQLANWRGGGMAGLQTSWKKRPRRHYRWNPINLQNKDLRQPVRGADYGDSWICRCHERASHHLDGYLARGFHQRWFVYLKFKSSVPCGK